MRCKWIYEEDIEFMACSVSILSLMICPGTNTDVTFQLFLERHLFLNHNSDQHPPSVFGTFPTLLISRLLSSPATGPFTVSFLWYPSAAGFFPTALFLIMRERVMGSLCSSFPSSAAALMLCLHTVFNEQ